MNPAQFVGHSDLLVSAMSTWPSFHDAEVLNIERTEDSCLATIHVFEMTNEVDPQGYFVLRRHHLVTFCMLGVSSNSLPESYSGDVLNSLEISKQDRQIKIDFESHMGNDGAVLCDSVTVISVDACDADGRVE
jgi:hypothetical protein